MNDPFYNLYSIIENHALGKFIPAYFSNLGDNNPHNLIRMGNFNDYIDYKKQSKQLMIMHDQEPIAFTSYKNDWLKTKRSFNLVRTDNILSNSELNSVEKDHLLELTGWKDFYWFSNGFLALEWYRYYKYALYLENELSPDINLSCYNRVIDGRLHRAIISGTMLKYDANKIILSCSKVDPISQKTLQELITTEYAQYSSLIDNVINYPNDVIINTTDYSGENRAFDIELADFRRSFCHIITERLFFEDRIHLTEKTFRPIVCCRPFIMVSTPNSLEYLKNYGFKTFSKYWDESYDSETNHTKRLDKIIRIMDDIAALSVTDLKTLTLDMTDILIFNRHHFYSKFPEIITKELYTNLDYVLNESNPKDGILCQVINSLTPEQFARVKLNEEFADVREILPFNLNDYLNASDDVKADLFDKHERFFRLFYKIIEDVIFE